MVKVSDIIGFMRRNSLSPLCFSWGFSAVGAFIVFVWKCFSGNHFEEPCCCPQRPSSICLSCRRPRHLVVSRVELFFVFRPGLFLIFLIGCYVRGLVIFPCPDMRNFCLYFLATSFRGSSHISPVGDGHVFIPAWQYGCGSLCLIRVWSLITNVIHVVNFPQRFCKCYLPI